MKFTLALTGLAVLATSATQVLATISAGTTNPGPIPAFHVAWIEGNNPCEWAWVANIDESLCANSFDPGNGFTYQFKFCGTNEFALYNGDGSFNSDCTFTNPTFGCNPQDSVTQTWQCP